MQTSIASLCNSVTQGVIATGVVNDTNIDHAVDVIRAEVKALLYGDEYADERACVHAGTVADGWVLRLVVLNAVGKIREN